MSVDAELLEGLIGRGLQAFNGHDADEFTELMTEDVVLEHSALPGTLRGRSEVRGYYADNVWRAFPDMRLELEDGPFLHPRASRFSVAWRISGTHIGRIDPPGLAPTGRRIDLPMREIVELRGEHVSRLNILLDMAGLLRQLGVLPPPDSRAERAMAALQRLQMKVPGRAIR